MWWWCRDVGCVKIEQGRGKHATLWNSCFELFGYRCCVVVKGESFSSPDVIGDEFYYCVWS